MTFFFFFLFFLGKSWFSGPPKKSSIFSETETTHPGLEVNKWGVMKVAGDEMKELDVNVPRLKVEVVVGCCWLVVYGG